jgi:WD40 repeat protein
MMACNFAASLTPTSSSTAEPSSLSPSQTEQIITDNNISQSSLIEFPGFNSVNIPNTNISDNPTAVAELTHWGKGSLFGNAIFSPDGQTIAIASTIGIYFYNAKTFEEKQFIDTGGSAETIIFSPDGNYITASIFPENRIYEIKIFDTKTGEEVQNLNSGYAPTYSPDGSQLAISSDQKINVFDVTDNHILYSIDVDSYGVTYSPDSQYFAAVDFEKSVNIYNASDGQLIQKVEGHKGKVRGIAFSPDGSQLATGSDDGIVKLWNISSGQLLKDLDRESINDVWRIAFSPDGKYLATGYHDGQVIIWDINTSQKLSTLIEHSWSIRSVIYSSDGQQLLSSGGGAVVLWDVKLSKPVHIFESVNNIKYLPNGQLLDISYNYAVRVWDANTGSLLHRLESGRTNYTRIIDEIRYSPDGNQIASIYRGGTVQVWDINTGKSLYSFGKHEGRVVDVGYLPDGWQVVIDTESNAIIQLWDLDTDEIIRTIETGHTDDISSATYSNDGQLLATGSRDKTSKLWNLQTGQLLYTLSKQYSNIIDELVFSPVGEQLIAIDVYGSASVWDINTGNSLYDLGGNFPVYSPDGKLIVARLVANNGFKIVFIDSNNGDWLATIDNNSLIVGFSSDGKILITDSSNGIFQIWGVLE